MERGAGESASVSGAAKNETAIGKNFDGGKAMNHVDLKIDRLLRSAAQGNEDVSSTAPFGFDTRVVALWRAERPGNSNGLARLLRRVAFTAASVIVISSAAALYEIKEEREAGEPFANEFAIADSAIQSEFPQ
jgi:hypothetical protein